jgi:ataxin-3
MSYIAVAIDQEEQALLGAGENMDTAGLRKGMTSHNVANDGNFSIQVIQKALLQYDNISCIPVENKEVKNSIKDYAMEKGFICNSKDHWLTIR